MNRNKAVNLIREFLEDKNEIPNSIEELKDFSFWDIKNKSKYGNGKSKPDADRTKLAYAIAWCLWGDDIRKCVENYTFEDLLIGKDFSGDTICNWNTMFNDSRVDPRYSPEIDYSPNEKKEILDFYELYQSIGNLYLLPNRKDKKSQSLNAYRGKYWGLKDYFDYFRNHLINRNNTIIENLTKENAFFFDASTTHWEKLRDTFYLQATENLKFKDKHYKHSDLTDKNKSEYKKFVLDFVRQSTEMIKTSSEKIIKKLKEIEELKEFSKE